MSNDANATRQESLPYKIACLCDLRDASGRVLLLRRLREPNKGLCSPIGGKLDVTTGESPAQCARREIREEAGLDVPIERLHLAGLISETSYEGRGHWLIFLYRVLGAVDVEPHDMREGRLEWFTEAEIDALPLPETDRTVIWPLIRRNEKGGEGQRPGFFAVHIDCRGERSPGDGGMRWWVEQEGPALSRIP
ncbi:MAG: NUDIX domain-containing protein [Phycisphaerae bacterium]|nr:NUDIX domain-containing protein [Phycisphaerae bacterium]